jgi:apolipoprotein N-acyltransferase
MNRLLHRITRPGWAGNLVAFASGALITLSMAPFDIWPLAVVAVLLFALSIQNASAAMASLRGWLMGSGLFLSGASWVYVSIHDHGGAPVWLALVLVIGFCLGIGLFGLIPSLLYARYLSRHWLGKTLGFAAMWALGEWFRSWFLTGFPWLYLGYSQTGSLLSGWAPMAGTFFISLIIALTAASLAYWLQTRARQPLVLLGICAVAWLAGPLLARIEWTTPLTGTPIRVALIQGNVAQEQKFREDVLASILRHYRDTTRALAPSHDLVVWPETAVPRLYQRVMPYIGEIDRIAFANDSAVLLGVPYGYEDDNGRGYYNSVVALGNAGGLYHKRHMVPFGEYVPLEAWLRGLIEFFDLPWSAFSKGPAQQQKLTLKTREGTTIDIAAYLCYEVAYPDVAPYAMPEAELLLTISNDTWFGRSIGPHQHMQIAQMRALESGRYMIRATNNGITALVDARGRITQQVPQFERTVLSGEVYAMTGSTPFGRTGDWPVLGLCVASLALTLAAQRRHPAPADVPLA